MKRLLYILTLLSFNSFSQTIYSWTPNVNPGWTSSNGVLNWQTGCNSVTTNCTGNYVNNINSYYESPVLDLSSCNGSTATVSFIVNGRAECDYDYLYLEYSTDGGVTYPASNWFWLQNCGGFFGISDVTFTNATVSHVVPTSSNFRYRLGFISDNSVNRAGYKVTNFKIDCNVVLSADIFSFDGENKDKFNIVTWKTLSELNNDFFELKYSKDGLLWETLNVQNSLGDNSEYSFKHYNYSEENYYKLTSTDFDGLVREYPEIVYIKSVKSKVYKTYNLLGQEVDERYKGVVIKYYENGVVLKEYN